VTDEGHAALSPRRRAELDGDSSGRKSLRELIDRSPGDLRATMMRHDVTSDCVASRDCRVRETTTVARRSVDVAERAAAVSVAVGDLAGDHTPRGNYAVPSFADRIRS